MKTVRLKNITDLPLAFPNLPMIPAGEEIAATEEVAEYLLQNPGLALVKERTSESKKK